MKKFFLVILTISLLWLFVACANRMESPGVLSELNTEDQIITQEESISSTLYEVNPELLLEEKHEIESYISEISTLVTSDAKTAINNQKKFYFQRMEREPQNISTLKEICLLNIEVIYLVDEKNVLSAEITQVFAEYMQVLESQKKEIERQGIYTGTELEYTQELREIDSKRQYENVEWQSKKKYLPEYAATMGINSEQLLQQYSRNHQNIINNLNRQEETLRILWENKVTYEELNNGILALETDRKSSIQNLEDDYNPEIARVRSEISNLEDLLK